MAGLTDKNLKIAKTIKLYVGGKFPRTESGRCFPIYVQGSKGASKEVYANQCQASRKDLRGAVEVAKKTVSTWESATAYLRGQILYRMAEMAEGKRGEFADILIQTMGYSPKDADLAVDDMVSSFVYYAGFTDKYQQVIGAVNPVSGPHHNFTCTEPVGVVGLIASDDFDLGELIDNIASIICSGNTLVVLLDEKSSAILAPLAEVFATSDLPGGVVNLLTGFVGELLPHFITHMEIQSISYQRDNKTELKDLQFGAVDNMKRVVPRLKSKRSLENILNHIELKTVWHPIGV